MGSIKYCAICGEKLPENRGNNRKYCSMKCRRISERDISKIAERANKIQNQRHPIHSAYDRKCAICGWQASDEWYRTDGKVNWSGGNEIHHIIPVCDGGTEDFGNLILLCPNHHAEAHFGILTADTLKKHIRKPKKNDMAKNKCTAVISAAIFGD